MKKSPPILAGFFSRHDAGQSPAKRRLRDYGRFRGKLTKRTVAK
jgi:hypothetical protein